MGWVYTGNRKSKLRRYADRKIYKRRDKAERREKILPRKYPG